MRIALTTETDTFTLEVPEDLVLENFKVLCEVESGVPTQDILISHNAMRLTDNKKTLKEYGVKDGDLLMCMSMSNILRQAQQIQDRARRSPGSSTTPPSAISQFDFSGIQVPSSSNTPTPSMGTRQTPEGAENQTTPNTFGRAQQAASGLGDLSGGEDPGVIRDMLLANPEQLAMLKHNNPRLADALESGDFARFASVLGEQHELRRSRERERIRLITADPFDLSAQRSIAEHIEKENIDANMEAAIEFNPESFGTVHMLYIDCRVNGHSVKAFIDSGAQTTIMSASCASRCNIMRLADRRWAGMAKGVGEQRILGRVHVGQVQIGPDFLASSFSILERQPMDMLLGLDMLKRHQMCIDLKLNCLLIGTTGTRTPFLAESDLPNMDEGEGASAPGGEEAVKKAIEDSKREYEEASMREEAEGASTPPEALGAAPLEPLKEEDVKELMKAGFSREACESTLRAKSGDKTQAMAALFAQAFQKANNGNK